MLGLGERQLLVADIYQLKTLIRLKKPAQHAALKAKILGRPGCSTVTGIQRLSGVKAWRVRRFLKFPTPNTTHRCVMSSLKKGLVAEFFAQEDVSLMSPEERSSDKRFCRDTQSILYAEYKNFLRSKAQSLCPGQVTGWVKDHVVAYSTFCHYRPRYVQMSDKIPPRMCVCDRCENVRMPARALTKKGLKGLASESLQAMLRQTWCKYDEKFPNYQCACRKCEKCGVWLLRANLDKENSGLNWGSNVAFKTWGLSGEDLANDNNKRIALMDKVLTVKDAVSFLLDLLERVSLHYFNAIYQVTQMKLCRDNLRPGQLLATMDFAQNYLHVFQDEPQGAHWMHQQSTLFPVVNQFVCLEPGCHEIVTWDQNFITGDIENHNHHAVAKFTEISMRELRAHNVPIKSVVRFTDNCCHQFKSKGPFLRLSQSDVPTVGSYFGARHGRSMSDRTAGTTKTVLKRM